jgi:glutaminyl-tRNA synthetase
MFVDFGMAQQYGGHCYLRYDDTNPEAEKQEYIDHIEEIVAWMGWTPWKITYASDYFQRLYDYAVQLIKAGHAYVCHQVGVCRVCGSAECGWTGWGGALRGG